MGVGVCISSPNNTNKVIKVNQLEDKDNVIDNFNYEEYAVDKDLIGKNNGEDNNISINDINDQSSSHRKKVKNVFENNETKQEEKKEENKIEEIKKEEKKEESKLEEKKKEENSDDGLLSEEEKKHNENYFNQTNEIKQGNIHLEEKKEVIEDKIVEQKNNNNNINNNEFIEDIEEIKQDVINNEKENEKENKKLKAAPPKKNNNKNKKGNNNSNKKNNNLTNNNTEKNTPNKNNNNGIKEENNIINEKNNEKIIENKENNNNENIENNNNENIENNNIDNNEKIENNENNNNNEINEEKTIKNDITRIKLPDVFSILTEKILLDNSYNEPIFVSELNKMSNFSVQEKVKYNDRFCVLTKMAFLIYHSKENYITVKRPLAEIPIRNINNIVLFKINKRMIGYDHFYISIDKNLDNNEINDNLDFFYFNDKKDDKNYDDDIMLIFKSMDKSLIKKWFVVLNYIKNLNNQLDEQEEQEMENKNI